MSDNPKEGTILPARMHQTALASERMAGRTPSGVIDSAVTRFVAGLRQKANKALAADAHARADYFDAFGRMARSYVGMNQAIEEANELSEILALDREQRSFNREEQKLDIAHRGRLAGHRRAQELSEAERGAFTSEQGLQNQKRLKELNLEIWEKRKQAEALDADVVAAKLRGADQPEQKKERTLLEKLQAEADELEKEILEAHADGKDTGGDFMALAELKALIARLRGT